MGAWRKKLKSGNAESEWSEEQGDGGAERPRYKSENADEEVEDVKGFAHVPQELRS
jgi:hypothetical protein